MTIVFTKTGLFDTIQDGGRYGFRKFGVPVSGFMDEMAAYIANELVGNSSDAALFEFTLKGPSLLFEEDCVVAVTGADMQVRLNGKPMNTYESIEVKAKDEMQFQQAKSGCRSYLAIGGKLESPAFYGSQSTYFYAGLGEVIKKGNAFQVNQKTAFVWRKSSQPFYPKGITLRILLGPEYERISGEELRKLQEEVYTLTAESNRMGCRLKGEKINLLDKTQILSSPILKGTVQLPASGQPLIFMSDAPTTGGYPRIAQVLRQDLVQLAQLKPGGFVRFKLVGVGF